MTFPLGYLIIRTSKKRAQHTKWWLYSPFLYYSNLNVKLSKLAKKRVRWQLRWVGDLCNCLLWQSKKETRLRYSYDPTFFRPPSHDEGTCIHPVEQPVDKVYAIRFGLKVSAMASISPLWIFFLSIKKTRRKLIQCNCDANSSLMLGGMSCL